MVQEKHVITYVIGNGFDIGILSSLGKSYKTSYQEFYDYLAFFLKDKKNNFIYSKIIEGRQDSQYLWSDYELLLEQLVDEKKQQIIGTSDLELKEQIYRDFIDNWQEIQYKFSDFLNFVISPSTLMDVSNMDGGNTLEKCLGDLSKEDYDDLKFKYYPRHRSLIQYNILNFNYSTLADNYFYSLRDPHPYNTSSNNSHFYSDPKGYDKPKDDAYYLTSKYNIFHPHGQLSIPSSILFGMSYDNPKYHTSKQPSSNYYNNFEEEIIKKMDKLYWCDSKEEIDKEIQETSLFIIFGHSIGKSDERWWKEILRVLSSGKSELIIYEFHQGGHDNKNEDTLKNNFLSYMDETFSKEQKELVEKSIHMIHFDDKENPLEHTFTFK